MNFDIRTVESKSDLIRFIRSQWNFYKGDKYWVPPVVADRMKLLNTEKNPFYKHSEIKLFTAVRKREIIGRIAAIVNYNHNKTHNDKVGFWGFFECINDQEVANALFDKAAEWLRSKDRDMMIGPENPSMNDEIGMLFDGYDSSPMILMTYNPSFYNDLCIGYGFEKAKDVYAYILDTNSFLTERIERMQGVIRERYGITIRQINLKDKKQFAKDVATLKEIYNSAWQPNWGFVKWTDEEFDFIANDLKLTADERLGVIAEVKGKVAGFGLALPDINQVLKFNKKGTLLGAVWSLLTKKKHINQCRVIALGIVPEFQKIGLDVVLYYEVGTRGVSNGYPIGEASWILEDNDMMNRGLTTVMKGKIYKKYRLYQKSL